MDNLDIAYLLFRFPSLTETFIAEEIQKIQENNIHIKVYSLLTPKDETIHPVSSSILPLVKNVPGIFHPKIWFAQIYYLFNNPGLYFNLLITLLRQPTKYLLSYIQRLTIFLKSVWVAKDLQSHKTQMIHTHFAWLSAAASWIVSRLLDIPFTVTTHAFDIYSERNDLLPLIADQAKCVVTISDHNKKAIIQMNSTVPEDKIRVIRCGIDLSFFSNANKNQIPSQAPLQITSVGSLIEKKGHEYLIRACANLKNQGIPFLCVIIGTGSQQTLLENLIHELDLNRDVLLAGKKSQDWVKNRLSESDIFVLACVKTGDNDQDGIPVAIMEAMAMGLPIISTAVSGIPELIIDEETGLIVEERDPESLSQAILRLSDDPRLRRTLSKNGYALVEQEYDIRQNVKKLRNIFLNVVEN
jgi:glycosyltransferase involved in cell wall biosynthesis